ncbi:hypothetical protein CDO29_01595 [Sinorhizobium meliloti]|nr:hypothetical protein CDO29_01595 [Sinorhizobium meliloti]
MFHLTVWEEVSALWAINKGPPGDLDGKRAGAQNPAGAAAVPVQRHKHGREVALVHPALCGRANVLSGDGAHSILLILLDGSVPVASAPGRRRYPLPPRKDEPVKPVS